MAGIGIELRRLTEKNSIFGMIKANLYAAILSSGSWVISISILLLIYFFLSDRYGNSWFTVQFLVLITYLTSFSLISCGIFPQTTIRYIADKIYEKKPHKIAGFLFSVLIIILAFSFLLGAACIYLFLWDIPWYMQILILSSFVALNILWLFANALAGIKEYRLIVLVFFLAYLIIFLLAWYLYPLHLTGLIIAYYVGQVVLITMLWVHLIHTFPMNILFDFKALRFFIDNKILMLSGLMLQLGFWADKYIFWFSPNTRVPILGSLYASPIYDLPMFIAFLTMIPGLAVFFYETEANFSYYYHRYYDSIVDGATYDEIVQLQKEQVAMAHEGIMNVIKAQAGICIMAIFLAPQILQFLHLSPIAVYILRIDFLSVFLAVLCLALINLLYYLNKNKYVAVMTTVFFLSNFSLTWLSLQADPAWFGYGFLGSTLITCILGIYLLNRAFARQTYETFMLH